MTRLQREPWFRTGSKLPVPKEILDAIPRTARLVPGEFDSGFFGGLQGVGIKIRNLIAEAGYSITEGPALDCHMMRYTVSLGAGAAPEVTNSDKYCHHLKLCFQESQWQCLNEVPASIGQLLYTRRHAGLYDRCVDAARQYRLEDGMICFLNHYPVQNMPSGNSG